MHMHPVWGGGGGGSMSSFCSLRHLETSLRAGSLHLLAADASGPPAGEKEWAEEK